MTISILWFISRIIDQLTTVYFLAHGGNEANPIALFFIGKYGDMGMLIMSTISTVLIYILWEMFAKEPILKNVLKLCVFFSFSISIYNILAQLITS